MIRILDSFVADKIAAGEVIERPLSIVKELVENSIDAGAKNIIIEIRNGGKSYIRVTDDGSGIPADEVELAFERHATGKISTLEDLNNINTLGFRGEALASIAAVSRLTMVTKTRDEMTGSKIVLHGGKVFSEESVGANMGTTIIVEDVFYNTPARKKFMKTDAAEASVIIDLIQRISIYYAATGFKFINNGQTIFKTPGDGDHLHAITEIYPSAEYRNLIEINGKYVHGYISDPGNTRKSRKGEMFFVNGRIVESAVIEKGIMKGYGDRLFSGFPLAILFITVEPDKIDVNIHPNKKEIKFLEENEIVTDIDAAVKAVLSAEESIPDPGMLAKPERAAQNEGTSTGITSSYVSSSSAAETEQLGIRDFLKLNERTETYTRTDTTYAPADIEFSSLKAPLIIPFEFKDLTIKGYVFDTYIITQAGENLFVLDQHAAHERILYEELIDAYERDEHLSQPILMPFSIETTADVYHMDRDWIDVLNRMGFDISDFGNNTFIIRGVPEYMSIAEASDFLHVFIDDIENTPKNGIVIDKLIMRSCKGAVKGGDILSRSEIEDLLARLSMCINPFSCPHGRPTFIKVTKYELERAFRRK
jgi:DNA mismatch repair protein MutL